MDRQQIGQINHRQINAALSADFLMSILWQPILRIVVKPAVIFHLFIANTLLAAWQCCIAKYP
jgi:hypothetical protein